MPPRPPRYTLFPYTTLFRSFRDEVTELSVHGEELYGISHKDAPRGKVIRISLSEQGEVLSRDVLNEDRKSTRLNSSHPSISYAVFCLKKKKRPPTTSAKQYT